MRDRKEVQENLDEQNNDATNDNAQQPAFERKPVVLFNDDGIPSVIVTQPEETGSKKGWRCRAKLGTNSYFNLIFSNDAYDPDLNVGTELLIYEVEFVSIYRASDRTSFSYFSITSKNCYEITKKGVKKTNPNAGSNNPNRIQRRSTRSDI